MHRICRLVGLAVFTVLVCTRVSIAGGLSCGGPTGRPTIGTGIDQTVLDSGAVAVGKPLNGIGINLFNLTVECSSRQRFLWLDNSRFDKVKFKNCALVYEGCPVILSHVVVDHSTINVDNAGPKATAVQAALDCGNPPRPDNPFLSCKDVELVIP